MDTKNYKVLHIFSGFGGGISSLILNLVENKADDFCFDTLAFNYQGGDYFVSAVERQGGHCFLMPRPRKSGYGQFIRGIDKVFAQGKYHAIHCHIAGWMCIPFRKIAKKYGVEQEMIFKLNKLNSRSIIRPGQTLRYQ